MNCPGIAHKRVRRSVISRRTCAVFIVIGSCRHARRHSHTATGLTDLLLNLSRISPPFGVLDLAVGPWYTRGSTNELLMRGTPMTAPTYTMQLLTIACERLMYCAW